MQNESAEITVTNIETETTPLIKNTRMPSYSSTNKMIGLLGAFPATVASAAAAMITAANSNKEFNKGYILGRNAGIAYERSNGPYHDLRAQGSAAIACTPLLPPIANGITAFFTLEAAWYFAFKAGQTGDIRYLYYTALALMVGAGLAVTENIANLTGCTELNGYLNGFEKGYDYACTQNGTAADCRDAKNVTDPNEGMRSFSGISKLATYITSPITAALALGGSAISYTLGRYRQHEYEAEQRGQIQNRL